MLVLSRKDGESIRISEEIEITVCDLRKGCVKLGIRCPDDVRILRGELSTGSHPECAAHRMTMIPAK